MKNQCVLSSLKCRWIEVFHVLLKKKKKNPNLYRFVDWTLVRVAMLLRTYGFNDESAIFIKLSRYTWHNEWERTWKTDRIARETQRPTAMRKEKKKESDPKNAFRTAFAPNARRREWQGRARFGRGKLFIASNVVDRYRVSVEGRGTYFNKQFL